MAKNDADKDEGSKGKGAKGETEVELLRQIRDLQEQSLQIQNRFLWVLLPIFALLAIQTILGLAGFFY